MAEPKISVIIPTFNRMRFLREAIDSVLAQTVPVHEIIVIDDGSTDDTEKAVKIYGGNVRYLSQKNQGPSAARNYGMREATGDWIAFLDSDDLWVPDKIQVQTDLIRQCPYLDFMFGDLSNFNEQKNDDKPEILNESVHLYLVTHAADLKHFFGQLLICNPVPTPTVLFRQSCLKPVGFFDETMRHCEDYDYWLRFAFNSRVGFIDRVLVRRRIHDTNAMKAQKSVYQGTLKVLKRWDSNKALSDETRRVLSSRIALLQYDLASHLMKRGEFKAAYGQLCELKNENFDISKLMRLKIWIKTLLTVGFSD